MRYTYHGYTYYGYTYHGYLPWLLLLWLYSLWLYSLWPSLIRCASCRCSWVGKCSGASNFGRAPAPPVPFGPQAVGALLRGQRWCKRVGGALGSGGWAHQLL